ncbi:unnamed protein product [Hymenolepis diminuta]|uniref:Uncharacterized protein n=1 Tax=Hymenolepis diminuta TaxID=6216 RepID=A0A564YWC6_HYMDI|nr:unnamed protein product [Hymenolepis diminuta]
MLWRGLTEVIHIKLSTHTKQRTLDSYMSCSSPLFLSMLPSLPPSYSFQTHCGFLEYVFGLLNSWRSASQFLLALTQTATN